MSLARLNSSAIPAPAASRRSWFSSFVPFKPHPPAPFRFFPRCSAAFRASKNSRASQTPLIRTYPELSVVSIFFGRRLWSARDLSPL